MASHPATLPRMIFGAPPRLFAYAVAVIFAALPIVAVAWVGVD